jgi:hypothetical protein
MRALDRGKRHLPPLFLALLAGVVACNPPMPKVSVEGEPEAIDALAGRWEGSYESEKNGREGTIQFDLTAEGDTARGEVLMMPAWSSEPYQGSARGEPRERRPVREPAILSIRFVRAQQGQVLGTLDPYIDPDCGCRVTTNFIGSVDGDEARGVFAIRGMQSWLAYGEWRARRVRATR